jgi:hypothetical protein
MGAPALVSGHVSVWHILELLSLFAKVVALREQCNMATQQLHCFTL